ncbi:hypothetical protein MRX96_011536 [Rhipicephalus microplus]
MRDCAAPRFEAAATVHRDRFPAASHESHGSSSRGVLASRSAAIDAKADTGGCLFSPLAADGLFSHGDDCPRRSDGAVTLSGWRRVGFPRAH